jgi:hypothetical protein
VRDIAKFPNGNSRELRGGTHNKHIKNTAGGGAFCSGEANAPPAKDATPGSRGEDEYTPPPGAVFHRLPEPPPGTAFEKIIWGAEKILRRRHDTALLEKHAADNPLARRVLRQRGR